MLDCNTTPRAQCEALQLETHLFQRKGKKSDRSRTFHVPACCIREPKYAYTYQNIKTAHFKQLSCHAIYQTSSYFLLYRGPSLMASVCCLEQVGMRERPGEHNLPDGGPDNSSHGWTKDPGYTHPLHPHTNRKFGPRVTQTPVV